MKAATGICLSMTVGALGAWLLTSSHYDQKLGSERRANETTLAENAGELRATTQRARAAANNPEVVTLTETVTVEVNPAEVLQQLLKLDPNSKQRFTELRHAVHHFETLTDLGPKALPAIRDFIASGEDLSFGRTYTQNRNYNYNRLGGNTQNFTIRINGQNQNAQKTQPITRTYTYYSSSLGSPSTGYLVPPTLRMGLFQVVAQTGGTVAEKLLADSLAMAKVGGEAAFLDYLLAEIAPDQYTDLALKVAHDLLLNPTEESARDPQHETQLYAILARHRDATFAKHAQELLVTDNGRLNQQALNYLNTVLKEKSVPLLAHALNDERLNKSYRASLIGYVMRYTGQHAQADQMFRDIMSQPMTETDSRKVYYTDQYKALSSMYYNADKETATKRKALIESVRHNITNDQLKRQLDSVEKRLDYQIDPKSNPWKKQGSTINGGTIYSYALPAATAESTVVETMFFEPSNGALLNFSFPTEPGNAPAPMIIRHRATTLDLRSFIPAGR
ncbi:MAG TPA: hypothetical protein EYQ62_06180 [Verrucomicrobiales bacterium]|nr:hypothetical protein [Verrucomicrobiales bacterium]HIL25682.1 hypothetical protein [Verrucomicrobiota bacterium]